MEQLTPNQVTSESIDHLGLVAATIHNVGLISLIDEILPINSNKGSNISMGQRVAGMILNGLGFIDNRLYMFPEFLSNKPIGRLLLDDNISHHHFNDDALGRCLDAIHSYGVESFFAKLAYPIALNQGLLGDSIHVDTTSLTLQGSYDFTSDQVDNIVQPINESLPTAEINYGHSKDHRPDLKQIVLAMATTGAAGFPIWMEVHSGNASDQKTLHEASVRMDSFIKDFDDKDRELIYVADSAAYSACVNQTDNLLWLSRVPEKSKNVIDLLELPDDTLSWEEHSDGYRVCYIGAQYKDVNQHWAIVSSEQAYKREMITFKRKLDNLDESVNKSLNQLSCHEFGCKQDAIDAISSLEKKWKYHKSSYEIIDVKKYGSSGRPKQDAVPSEIIYKINGTILRDEVAIELNERRKGRFVIATNDLTEEKVSMTDMLKCYKSQASTESGFGFIKGNDFQVSSVFLKTPSRIAALMAIMTLCLMIYSIAQHQLREGLKDNEETVPDRKNNETNNPTLSRVFRLFIGIQLLNISSPGIEQAMVINMNQVRVKIVKLFGSVAMEIYGLAAENKTEKNLSM